VLEQSSRNSSPLLGVLRGEGVGPEVVDAALKVLKGLQGPFGLEVEIEFGEPIGAEAHAPGGNDLLPRVEEFCRGIFKRKGSVLAGAGGGRFVYDLRDRFQLFYKLNPILSYPELRGVRRLKGEFSDDVDVLVVRENLGGLYQGKSRETKGKLGAAEVEHTFSSTERQVAAVLEVARSFAESRSGRLAVVIKDSGLPELSALWKRMAKAVAGGNGIECEILNVDYAVFRLVEQADTFDVIVAPNCFGDILSDLAGVFGGSRGLTFGASYSKEGHAVYQTNHGAAHDIAGLGRANPAGQIFSTAMWLDESLGKKKEAVSIVESVREAWRQGWRTEDVAEPGCKISSTGEFAEIVVGCLRDRVDREACV